MRILFVSEVYPSPEKTQYGIFIKQQADALIALGNSVDILVPNRCAINSTITKSQYEKTGVYRFNYKTLRYEIFPLLAVGQVYKNIESLLTNGSYDLVAVHITSDTILKLLTKLCNKHKIKVLAHYHGLNVWKEYKTYHPLRERLYSLRRLRILKRTNGVVGVSNKVSDIVRSRLKKVPVTTVYNGVDMTLFSEKKREDNLYHIIGVGNLIEIKGFKYLIEAFAKLNKEFPDTRLGIMGTGVLEETLKALAKDLEVENKVTFYGYQPYENVAKQMSVSDMFVLPSFYEALGCVYLEAMSCGLPTVGIEGMGIDEIILDGQNGLLAKPKDTQSLYEKMRLLVKDEKFAEKIAIQGQKTAKEYTWEKSAITLNEFYKSV